MIASHPVRRSHTLPLSLSEARALLGFGPGGTPPGLKSNDPEKSTSRVFATTHGASQDIINPGFRRMLINAHFWCLGMEDAIEADGTIDFVGPHNPVDFNFGGYRRGVRAADFAGWDTPIYVDSAATRDEKKASPDKEP